MYPSFASAERPCVSIAWRSRTEAPVTTAAAIDGGILQARNAVRASEVVARRHGDEHAGGFERGDVAFEEIVRVARVVAAAERQVDGDDVVLRAVGDDPLQTGVHVRPGAVLLGIEHLEGDDVGVWRDARKLSTGRSDLAGDERAVAVVVHR